MKKTLRLSIRCAFVLFLGAAIASPAIADDDRSFYVQYNGGATFVPNQNLTAASSAGTSNTTGQLFSGSTKQNPGFAVGGAVGTRFLDFLRAELEYMYRESDVSRFAIQTSPSHASGDVGVHTVMVNAYVDLDLDIGIIPYAGIGIGWGRVNLNIKNREQPELSRIDSNDAVFAYSLLAGGAIPVNEVVDITLGYRYLRTTDSEVSNSLVVRSTTPTGRRNAKMDYEYDTHEALFGLRINF